MTSAILTKVSYAIGLVIQLTRGTRHIFVKERLVLYHVVWFIVSHSQRGMVCRLTSIWKCVYSSLNNCKLQQTQAVNSLTVTWLLTLPLPQAHT